MVTPQLQATILEESPGFGTLMPRGRAQVNEGLFDHRHDQPRFRTYDRHMAQQQALETAMLTCGPARREYPAFTVVAHVAADGATDRTWRNSEAPYAVCMDRELSVVRLPVAAGKAFHVSYELSFAP